jgi:TusA-related sulfurtransferase
MWYEDTEDVEEKEHDLSNLICPLSKIKAVDLIDSLKGNETIRIILGDPESLKSVAQELKARGIRPSFEQKSENSFILTIKK